MIPNAFNEVDPTELKENPFLLIGSEWMLLTGGVLSDWNTMTASWGGWGVLWDRNVCFIFVRNTRYTLEFLEKYPRFTLCFFEEAFRPALRYCGAHSGRNVNKAEAASVTPAALKSGAVYFAEARLVIEARTLYHQDIDPTRFLDPTIEMHYPLKDYHRMYIGEIANVFTA